MEFQPDMGTILDKSITEAFEKIYDAFKFMLWKKGIESRLTPLQIQLLVLMHQRGDCCLSDLARWLHLSKATLTEAVKTLETKEYVFKERNGDDNRRLILKLSWQGELLAQQMQEYRSPFEAVLAGFDQDEKEMLQINLFRVIEKMQKEGLVSTNRMCFSCSYYRGDKQDKHFCTLLNQKLGGGELKLYCREHVDI